MQIKNKWQKGVTVVALAGGAFAYPFLASNNPSVEEGVSAAEATPGLTSAGSLGETYNKWAKSYGASNPTGPVATLLWTRGLSTDYSAAKGIAQFDLGRNKVSVRVNGLESQDVCDVWVIENSADGSVAPEAGDRMIKLGSLQFEGQDAWLDAQVENLASIIPDVVVVARRGEQPSKSAVITGTTSLFQKMFHYPAQTMARLEATTGTKSNSALSGTAHASAGLTPPGFFADLDANLVNKGRRLFFNETFEGNGRSCGTCHHEEDNMALSLTTIANLPANDPLFIVEQPTLADGRPNALFNEFRMERPSQMRLNGLILENLDGFRELDGSFTRRAVMRAPNHVLSVRTTLAPPPAVSNDGTLPVATGDLVFEERTGWSGDGTPTGFNQDFFNSNGRDLTGSLRDFVVGAVFQHYPLTLERSTARVDANGRRRTPDFRMPTEAELDAIEAFMLSIGRQKESADLNTVRLSDVIADRGRLNYMGFNVFDADPNDGRPALNCNACHFNGGANTNPVFPFPPAVTPNHDLADLARNGGSIPSHNRSFGPQVERLADQAGDIIAQVVKHPSVAGICVDKGLAQVPLLPGDRPGVPSAGCDGNPFDNGFAFGFGDPFAARRIATDRFNVPPVFEAMDTPPFFHGHQINTPEGSVAFYAANRHLRNGEFLGAIVPMNAAQVINTARFIRVMGADFNIEQALTVLRKARKFPASNTRARRINTRLAIFDIKDAQELLAPVELHILDAQPMLQDAISALRDARASASTSDSVAVSSAEGFQDADATENRVANDSSLLVTDQYIDNAIAILESAQAAMVKRGVK